MSISIEKLHFVKGLDAVADAFAGTVTSDIVSLRNHNKAIFLVHKGVGLTGTSTITVEACDDTAGTNASAVPFRYRAVTSGDTPGALTTATSAGFTTTAGSSQLYLVEVEAEALAASGYSYVRLKAVEVANDPVLGGIIAILAEPRYATTTATTAIT